MMIDFLDKIGGWFIETISTVFELNETPDEVSTFVEDDSPIPIDVLLKWGGPFIVLGLLVEFWNYYQKKK